MGPLLVGVSAYDAVLIHIRYCWNQIYRENSAMPGLAKAFHSGSN